jgi:hypothetical protein
VTPTITIPTIIIEITSINTYLIVIVSVWCWPIYLWYYL